MARRAPIAARAAALTVVSVLCLVTAACGDGSVFETSPTTTSTTATTTTTTTSTTTTTLPPTTTTTTTSLPPTTTTTLPPPLPVIGWEGPGLRSLAVVVAFDYDPGAGLGALVESAVEAMGLEVDGSAEAVLALDLAGTPRSGEYGDAGTCYTGARVQGTLALSAPGQATLRFDLDGERATAPVVIGGNCHADPGEAPFASAFEPEFMDAVVAIWGPGSVPYLTEILRDDLFIIRIRIEAVAAFRLMDREAIPVEEQYAFLAAALWFVERTLYMGEAGEITTYREAVRRMLLDYSETDYGLEDQADVTEWQTWLLGWLADQ